MCVHQEDRGRGVQAGRPSSHPPPNPAFQRKSRLRSQRWAQHGHHSPTSLAPGPCHMEQGDISRMAWPCLPLTPTVYTHSDPHVSPPPLCIPGNSSCTRAAPGSRSLTSHRDSPTPSACRQDSVNLAPRFLVSCICLHEATASIVTVLFLSS